MAEPAPALPKVLPPGKQVFDQHSPPSQQLIDECVHCGFCLPTCPTYSLWYQEMDSPRGRIYLMKMGLEGQVEGMNETYVTHFDRCLGCMACVSSCPSGVKYDRLIEATRAQIERNYPRSWAERSFRRMILWLFPHPNRLRVALFPMWIYQRLGLRWLLHKLGLIRLLPERYRALEALLPEVPLRSMWTNLPVRFAPAGPARRRVGLLLGCVQRTFFSEVNAATARVLAAEGCEVIIPRHQGCCGALGTHAGDEQQAHALARRTIDVFERAQVDTIVINAAGCGSNMKEYGYLLRHDPAYADRAKAFAAKCKDVSEVLAELEPQAARHPIPLPLRIAYQDACHLQHAQAVRSCKARADVCLCSLAQLFRMPMSPRGS
jgi:glycolate oxidase iron-sulfur subunit